MSDTITLYPSNWLYNAGVVGLLQVLEATEKVSDFLGNDGSFYLDKQIFNTVKIKSIDIPKVILAYCNFLVSENELKEWLNKENKKKKTNKEKYKDFCKDMGSFGYKFVRAGNKLFASNTPYQNLVQLSEWQSYEFPKLVGEIPNLISSCATKSTIKCGLCLKNSVKITNPRSKLQDRLTKLQITHLKELGPSIGEFPNGFWNCDQSIPICYLCAYLIIHHHLAFTRLQDNSEIFLNAPSFNVMYHLNKFAREVYSKQETKDIRQLLGMSIIEYATKMQVSLGIWVGMNIEVVSRHSGKIDFFNLPYEVTQLLVDRNIASLLGQIGEFAVLNFILNQNFSRLLEFGYRLLQIGLKPQAYRGKSEKEFVNQNLRLEDNRKNPVWVAEQIFKLFAFIEEKQKRRKEYEHIYTT